LISFGVESRIKMTKRIFVFVLFLILLSAFLPQKAGALTLIPPLLEFGVEPGGEIVSKIKVLNETAETTTFYTSTANFNARDEFGNPNFLFEEKGGLADWIEINPGPIVLLPGERQDILFTVKVPNDADPGGHYAGIFFGSGPPQLAAEKGGQIGVVAKLGMLLLLRVSGDITIKSAIQEFHILNNQRFFTRLPVQFWYRLYNSGNLHIRPAGVIEIKNIFGLTSAKITANPVEGAVLPDSIRRFEPVWKKSEPPKIEYKNFFQNFFSQALAEYKNFAFGYYTASLKLSNVPESQLAEKISFWVFPWRFLLISIIVLTIIILIIFTIISRYNRWIIKRARASLENRK